MVDYRVVMRIQENLVALIHVPWMAVYIFRGTSGALSLAFALLICAGFKIPPFEETVRTVVAVRASELMRLEESSLRVRKSIYWIGMNYHDQQCSDTRSY